MASPGVPRSGNGNRVAEGIRPGVTILPWTQPRGGGHWRGTKGRFRKRAGSRLAAGSTSGSPATADHKAACERTRYRMRNKGVKPGGKQRCSTGSLGTIFFFTGPEGPSRLKAGLPSHRAQTQRSHVPAEPGGAHICGDLSRVLDVDVDAAIGLKPRWRSRSGVRRRAGERRRYRATCGRWLACEGGS